MAIRLIKPWLPLSEARSTLKGQMGVYQLADAQGVVIFIGFAGGKSLFGLQGEVSDAAARISNARQFRVEITTSYLSRFRELMMVHVADCGEIPQHNEPLNLGRLSPA